MGLLNPLRCESQWNLSSQRHELTEITDVGPRRIVTFKRLDIQMSGKLLHGIKVLERRNNSTPESSCRYTWRQLQIHLRAAADTPESCLDASCALLREIPAVPVKRKELIIHRHHTQGVWKINLTILRQTDTRLVQGMKSNQHQNITREGREEEEWNSGDGSAVHCQDPCESFNPSQAATVYYWFVRLLNVTSGARLHGVSVTWCCSIVMLNTEILLLVSRRNIIQIKDVQHFYNNI